MASEGEHSGPRIGTLNPPAGPAAPASTTSPAITIRSEHQMFVAIGVMTVFVLVATTIAGTGKSEGRAMLTVMFLLLVIQGIGHVNPFTQWVLTHPLQPKG